MELIYEDIHTPVGTFRIAERDGAVVAAAFEDGWTRVLARFDRARTATVVPGRTVNGPAVRAYFAGDLAAVGDIAVAFEGSEFQTAVWERLRAIPTGETISYSQLAAAIGSPRACRAVGSANGANPISVIVPCHRVVRSDGSTGGYGGGSDRKRWLLQHEQVI